MEKGNKVPNAPQMRSKILPSESSLLFLSQHFISIVFKSSVALLEFRFTWETRALLSLWKCRHSSFCWTKSEIVVSTVLEGSLSQKAKKCYPAPGYFSMSPALQLGAEYNSQASWSCRNQSVRRLPILGREGNGFRRKGFSTSTTETMTSYGQLHSFTLLSTIPKHLPKEENKKRKE